MTSQLRQRPPVPGDVAWLEPLVYSPADNLRWRSRGGTPSPDALQRLLWEGVLFQAVAEPAPGSAPRGLYQLYDVDLRSGVGEMGIVSDLAFRKTVDVSRHTGAFLRHAFTSLPLRKIFTRVLEPHLDNYSQILPSSMKEEARLEGHDRLGASYVATLHLAIFADDQIE